MGIYDVLAEQTQQPVQAVQQAVQQSTEQLTDQLKEEKTKPENEYEIVPCETCKTIYEVLATQTGNTQTAKINNNSLIGVVVIVIILAVILKI